MSGHFRPPSHQSNFVHFSFLAIFHKMYFASNIPCVLGIRTIMSHTHSRISIQYNYRSLLWNYIWILVQQLMN